MDCFFLNTPFAETRVLYIRVQFILTIPCLSVSRMRGK